MNYNGDDKIKAKEFSLDARIFLRSLNDALVCTKQISGIKTSRNLYYNVVSQLETSLKNKDIFLGKYCDHDVCNTIIIASSNFKSYQLYFTMKFSVNLFLNFYDGLNKARDYFELEKELDRIHTNLKNDLSSYVSHTKIKHLLVTKE